MNIQSYLDKKYQNNTIKSINLFYVMIDKLLPENRLKINHFCLRI